MWNTDCNGGALACESFRIWMLESSTSSSFIVMLILFCCSGLVPLHNACSYGHFEVTQLLIKHGASVNAVDLWQFSPLHEAASKSRSVSFFNHHTNYIPSKWTVLMKVRGIQNGSFLIYSPPPLYVYIHIQYDRPRVC